MLKKIKVLSCLLSLTIATSAWADLNIPMYYANAQGKGAAVGNIVVSQTKYGLLFTPKLYKLTPGLHGFHIHMVASCAENGMAAGGHFDPAKTGKHLGPYNDNGHLGDLPALFVAADGTASLPVLAPRLKNLTQIKNHSLMIHEGGDNYSDTPAKLGGGGMRMVCGIIN